MKKKILIVSIALIGLILVFTGHSFAASKKGGHYQKWDKPAAHHYAPDRGHHPGSRPYLVKHRHGPKHHGWHHPRFHRRDHHRWVRGRPHRTVVRQINNYYISDHGYYEPQDHLSVDAFVSDTGFSISVGVSAAD